MVNLEWSPSCWTQGKDQEATWDNNGWVTWHVILQQDSEQMKRTLWAMKIMQCVREPGFQNSVHSYYMQQRVVCCHQIQSAVPHPTKRGYFQRCSCLLYFTCSWLSSSYGCFPFPFAILLCCKYSPNSTGAVYVVAWFLHATVVSSFPGPCSFQLHVNCGGYIGGGTLLLSAKNFSSQKSCAESGEASNCKLMYIQSNLR